MTHESGSRAPIPSSSRKVPQPRPQDGNNAALRARPVPAPPYVRRRRAQPASSAITSGTTQTGRAPPPSLVCGVRRASAAPVTRRRRAPPAAAVGSWATVSAWRWPLAARACREPRLGAGEPSRVVATASGRRSRWPSPRRRSGTPGPSASWPRRRCRRLAAAVVAVAAVCRRRLDDAAGLPFRRAPAGRRRRGGRRRGRRASGWRGGVRGRLGRRVRSWLPLCQAKATYPPSGTFSEPAPTEE